MKIGDAVRVAKPRDPNGKISWDQIEIGHPSIGWHADIPELGLEGVIIGFDEEGDPIVDLTSPEAAGIEWVFYADELELR